MRSDPDLPVKLHVIPPGREVGVKAESVRRLMSGCLSKPLGLGVVTLTERVIFKERK